MSVNDLKAREGINMKRKLCIALAALTLMLTLTGWAAPELSPKLLKTAQSAAGYLASGEYERLVTLLPFSGIAPGAAEWERFARNYDTLAWVEPKGAVACWKGESWIIAVPMAREIDEDTEALMLLSEDGKTFTGYRYATWGQVEKECARCDTVLRDGL